MNLSKEDSRLFYALFMLLLDYTNQTHGINKQFHNMIMNACIDPGVAMQVAKTLYSHRAIIDQYIKSHDNLPSLHKDILLGWKRAVTGTFIIERYLKKGTIFIDEQGKVYQVQGIISPIEEILQSMPLPLFVDATLLPFKDVIIIDGLLCPEHIYFGPHATKHFKDSYLEAKRENNIIKVL